MALSVLMPMQSIHFLTGKICRCSFHQYIDKHTPIYIDVYITVFICIEIQKTHLQNLEVYSNPFSFLFFLVYRYILSPSPNIYIEINKSKKHVYRNSKLNKQSGLHIYVISMFYKYGAMEKQNISYNLTDFMFAQILQYIIEICFLFQPQIQWISKKIKIKNNWKLNIFQF